MSRSRHPPYALRRGLGFWTLTFAGEETVLRHEQGLLYVAYLLRHPPARPLHALDLIARTQAAPPGLTELVHPHTGKVVPLERGDRVQERSLGLEDAQALRALLRQEQELERLLDDPEQPEPVKAEVQRELAAVAAYRRQHGRRGEDAAQRSARAVRRALQRLHHHLVNASDEQGEPHPVLRRFADHLERHLLLPSARCHSGSRSGASRGVAGCFTYEPPIGVIWSRCS